MKNQVLFFNESAYLLEERNAAEAKPQIQTLIDEFTSLNLFTIENLAQVKKLIAKGEKWIKEQITELVKAETPSIGKFRMKIGPIVDQIELPDLTGIDSLCFALKKHEHLLDLVFKYKDGKIEIDTEALEKRKERYSLIAQTTAQNTLFDKHIAAAKALNDFETALKEAQGHGIYMEGRIDSIFSKEHITGEIVIRSYYYESIWPSLQKFAEQNK